MPPAHFGYILGTGTVRCNGGPTCKLQPSPVTPPQSTAGRITIPHYRVMTKEQHAGRYCDMRNISIYTPFAPPPKPGHSNARRQRFPVQHLSQIAPLHVCACSGQRLFNAPLASKGRSFQIARAEKASVPSVTTPAEARDDDVRSLCALCSAVIV